MRFPFHPPRVPDTIFRFTVVPWLAVALVSCDREIARQEHDEQREPGRVFRVDDYPGRDDREKINNAMAAMGKIEGNKILRFSKREYQVRPLAADSSEPVLGSSGVRNLTIDGGGAVLVAMDSLECRAGYFFQIRKFADLTVRDLTLTYRPATIVQGMIVSADQPGNHATIMLDPKFGNVGSLVQTPMSKIWCRVGHRENPCWPKPGNPSWLEIGVDGAGKLIAEAAGPGHVSVRAGYFDRAQTINGEFNWQPGDPIVIWKRGAQDGFCFEDGHGLSLERIRVQSALHYAIKLRGVISAKVADCHVSPAPGAMISSSADGIDVQQSKDIAIGACSLVATGDDAISFLNHGHGDNGRMVESRFGPPYPETNDGVVIRDNVIEGGNRNAILLLASRAEIAGNTIRHTRQYGIKFCGDDTRIINNRFTELGSFAAYRHITDELDTGIICSDEWQQHRASIRNNVIEDWHNMPALLVKSITNARVTGNTFVMREPARIRKSPFNPYLESLPAICISSGHFNGSSLPSSEIAIEGNAILSPGGWRDAGDAIIIRGSHSRIEERNNSSTSDDPNPNIN